VPTEFRWDFHGPEVLDEVAKAPKDVREDFARLMDRLTLDPRSRRAGVRPLRTEPGGFTAPFDDALLVYRVLRDYPRMQLLLLVWLKPE
jgi:hypothetical protein